MEDDGSSESVGYIKIHLHLQIHPKSAKKKCAVMIFNDNLLWPTPVRCPWERRVLSATIEDDESELESSAGQHRQRQSASQRKNS